MSKDLAKIGMAVAVVGVAALFIQIAAADPHCDRGCQSNLQHLFQHVLDDAVGGLLASS